MYLRIPFSTAILPDRNSINRSRLQRGFRFALLAFALPWFALSPIAEAVDPPPDGGYPGNNTAEGTDALFNLTTATNNTAIGFKALFEIQTGTSNTAVGSYALNSGDPGLHYNTAIGAQALKYTERDNNTAIGLGALSDNEDASYSGNGYNNTAIGMYALEFNNGGNENTATGLGRSEGTTTRPLATTTRPLATTRSGIMSAATKTPRAATRRSKRTPATTTRPAARVRSLKTQPGVTIRPTVSVRFLTTLLASITSQWAQMQASISLRAVRISMSATEVLRANRARFASGPEASRRMRSLPAYTAGPSPAVSG